MSGLHQCGVGELVAGYASRQFSPVEVVDACLDRIERGADCGAVVALDADRARHDAAAAADRWARGVALPLDGVPFGVKDIIATEGVRTTLGSTRFANFVPDADASSVARLRGSGAVMVGKLATPEYAFGDALEGHQPHNPWAPEHWTGGSSSGSAVAVAARVLPLALGTDTGGSIRVPASYCGVTGLKPTTGRVATDGVGTVSWTLDHVGPMARSASDVALALGVLVGDETLDVRNQHSCAATRIGVPRSWLSNCDDDTALATETAIAMFGALGATITAVEMPSPDLAAIAAWAITVAEFAEVHADWRHHVDEYTPAAAERLAAGSALPASDYLRSLRVRHELQARCRAVFESVDVMITPATPGPAPRIVPPLDPIFFDGDRMWLDSVARYLIPFNLLGSPAIVVPSGRTDDGRPTGIQIVGRPGEERAVLAAAAAFQSITDHHTAEPPARSSPVAVA